MSRVCRPYKSPTNCLAERKLPGHSIATPPKPRSPAELGSDVLAVLVAEGESDGWLFTDRSATLAVGTKEIDGRPWMASVAVSGDTVQQLLAGR